MSNPEYHPGPFIVRHVGGFQESWPFADRADAERCANHKASTHPAGHSFIIYDSNGCPFYEVKS